MYCELWDHLREAIPISSETSFGFSKWGDGIVVVFVAAWWNGRHKALKMPVRMECGFESRRRYQRRTTVEAGLRKERYIGWY